MGELDFQAGCAWLVGGVALFYFVNLGLTGADDVRPVRADDKDKRPDAQEGHLPTSYDQVSKVLLGEESFQHMMEHDLAVKTQVMKRQHHLLEQRYDLADHASKRVFMDGGGTQKKPVQVGPATRLPEGVTWEQLAEMSPDEIKTKDLFPRGFMALPHPNQDTGGMVFPQMEIKLLSRLERFDLDFDIPEHFLPAFPPALYLTMRTDLGDVSQGRMVTIDNFQELFNGILNSKDLEGLRLLVTQFPQQQFNATRDRKVKTPSMGVACLDCHVNGHTSAATHLVGDIRPQSFRHRIDTPSLRGVNVQRLFGSQRALKNVEDFTEFEQRAAYFDGDILSSAAKGINPLNRGSQVHFMAEMQDLLGFPPAPLGLDGKLDAAKFSADSDEMKGQELFFGKAKCSMCHPAPYYTDNLMHDLQLTRFFKPRMINGIYSTNEGPIKTFPLRGIKDSPPYFHDGRLLTLEDTVEFFNLILETKLNKDEKKQLVAFMRQL